MIGSTIFLLDFHPKEVFVLFLKPRRPHLSPLILSSSHEKYEQEHFSFDTMKILSCHRTLTTRFLSQGYEGYHFLNTFKKFYGRNNGPVGQYRKISAKCSWFCQFD